MISDKVLANGVFKHFVEHMHWISTIDSEDSDQEGTLCGPLTAEMTVSEPALSDSMVARVMRIRGNTSWCKSAETLREVWF